MRATTNLHALAFVFLLGCGGSVDDAADSAAGGTSSGGGTANLAGGGSTVGGGATAGNQTAAGGGTSSSGTTSGGTTSGGTTSTTTTSGDSVTIAPNLPTTTALPTGSSTQLTFDVTYAGVAAGTVFHLELCAADRDGTTGELSVRTETQDFGIDMDMAALPEAASAYGAAYGTACDLAYLLDPADNAADSTTTTLSITPPVLSPAYDVVRLRPFAYDSDTQQIQFVEQSGSAISWVYAIQ